MPPPLSSEPKPKPKFGPSRSHIPLPRQGTLDKFFNRSSGNLPTAAASSSSTTANKTPTKQTAPPRSTFAVVIKLSPSKHATTPPRTVEDDADDLVISDLSPQFRRLAAQAASGVSLAKPVLPDIDIDEPEEEAEGEAEATSSGATPQPQPKRRGRPKGSNKTPRPATEGPRKLRPDRPKAGSMYAGKQKRRGRPPRAESPKPRAIYEGLNPHFNVFICEWQGCEAELHNFSTLKKHVMIVHARNSPFQCRWAKCAERQPPGDFPTSADLTSHIEDLHMLPIAWQVGDGPQVSFKRYAPDDGTELPAYLFDKAGNQITPSIRDQREEDFISWRNNRRRLKDLLLLRDQNLPSEEEDNGMEDVVVEGE
ncbi:C2H2 finger domain-containing protein [Colletotrichum karsti]|uniref:C2H2 finger domain-containing protein n=1 Tax=Colletotrichum karsti TaxID=1095194 RepID=A0A9P6I5K4_9PEZI|nr:C2H2 finger domain-containing protein [Colletotrichum karsti]KAF9877703.1 C2H2 finger domain-containing protein [Colletotrichum karsti]